MGVMMFQCLILVFAIATVYCRQDNGVFEVHANGVNGRIYEVDEVNLNSWFDRALPFIKIYARHHELEPMSIPDIILPVTTEPESTLYMQECLAHGITNFSRSDDVILYKYKHLWELDMQLNWRYIDVTCDYAFDYLMFRRRGSLEGRFHALNVATLTSIYLEERKVHLKYLKIIDAGNFSFQLHGHLIDPIVNAAIEAVTHSLKERILHEIESQMYNAAEQKIDELNEWLANHTNIDISNLFHQSMLLQL